MKNVTITVSGAAGTGKTAIAQIIFEALQQHGITVSEFPPEVSPGRSAFDLGRAVGSLQCAGLSVKLREVHAPKESSRELS